MDIITQCLTGAVFAQAACGRTLGRSAALVGLVGGGLADADMLLTPLADPALPHALHRHFTHALVFIPAGAALAAAPFLAVPKLRENWKHVLLAALVAYATHGLLDNTTSYGTHLLWPFVDHRTSWDCMSIVDPIFTLMLLAGVAVAVVRGSPVPARVAATLALLYIGLGVVQHRRADIVQRELAAARGHAVERGRVMPTLGNLIVWRSIYEHDGRLHADAVRVPLTARPRARPGGSVPRFTAADLPPGPQRMRDVFAEFDSFTDGYTAEAFDSAPGRPVLGDMRISMDTSGFAPLWGLAIDPDAPDDPARAASMPHRDNVALSRLWEDVVRPGAEFAVLP